jgi:hypothetical protein
VQWRSTRPHTAHLDKTPILRRDDRKVGNCQRASDIQFLAPRLVYDLSEMADAAAAYQAPVRSLRSYLFLEEHQRIVMDMLSDERRTELSSTGYRMHRVREKRA